MSILVKWLVKKFRGGEGGVGRGRGGVGRSREGLGHEVLNLMQGVGRTIFSYPLGVGHPILLHR